MAQPRSNGADAESHFLLSNKEIRMPKFIGGKTANQISKPRYDLQEVKRALPGRAVAVLRDVAGIPEELLDGRHHPCPLCDGKNRFRLIDSADGAIYCNQCFNGKNGDAIAAVMHFRNVRLPEALRLIGEYLGVSPIAKTKGRRSKNSEMVSMRNEATEATKPTEIELSPSNETIQETVEPKPDNADSQMLCDSIRIPQPVDDGVNEETPNLDECEDRHEIYSLILSKLGLSNTHRESLHLRGLSDTFIDSANLRSVDPKTRTGQASKALREWVNDDPGKLKAALSVPGIIQYDGRPLQFRSPLGLLIPVRNSSGKIIALRIRLDSSSAGGKYRWISSRRPDDPLSPSPGTPCHVPLGISGPIDTVRITEGELKAEVAFALSGIPTVSIAGVNTWKQALPLVEKLQPIRILVSMDADFRTNPAVASAVRGLVTSLSESYEVAVETWEAADGKGIDDLLSSGGVAKIVEGADLDALLAELPASSKFSDSSKDRIQIKIDCFEQRVNDEVIGAMASDENLFSRSGQLVRIVREDSVQDGIVGPSELKRIRSLEAPTLRELMTKRICFRQNKVCPNGEIVEVDAHPPGWCVGAVLARGVWPGIRPLLGIVTTPILRPDGSIVSTNGYDPLTGLYLSTDLELPPFPAVFTHADAVRAAEKLLDLVCDFPFSTPEHRSAWLAFLLTASARTAFSGPAPLFLIDANIRGSGKSMLSDVVGFIAMGTTLPRMSNPKDDEECRKRITSLALAGDRLVLIDNIDGHLGCPSLDAALTSPDSWKDRILGKSEVVELPISMTWVATGNNVMLAADTARRTLHIRLDSLEQRPELRSGFKYSDLINHVKRNRAELVEAVLTILSAYCAAGRPRMNLPAWGSFEGWSNLIRNAVVWCGLPDPGLTREELAKKSDEDANTAQLIINHWRSVDHDGVGVTAAEVLRRLETESPTYDPLREALCDLCRTGGDRLPSPKSLGMRLQKYRGRVVNGMIFDSYDHHGTARWYIRPVKSPVTSCSGGCSGSESAPLESQPDESKPLVASENTSDVVHDARNSSTV
jgi:hypothetical protein